MTINENDGENAVNNLMDYNELIKLNEKSIYYYLNSDLQEQFAAFLENRVLVQINSIIEKEELLKIAAHMKQKAIPSEK